MTLRPSSVPQRVVLPSPPASSLPALADPSSDLARASSPTITHFLATVVADPTLSSPAASALVAELVDFAAVAELVDFAAVYRLNYLALLVSDPAPACPPSVGGEIALGCGVLEDRQEDLECLATASPHLATMLLAPEGDPDALDIPTPRSYREAISGEYSSQWQTTMDADMASWKSTGTYVDQVPPPGANIVSGMCIFRVKRPSGSPPAFKARYVARGFIYGLRQAPRKWHDTPRMMHAALGFSPSTADPSLFSRTDTTLLPYYVLVYVDDLVFAPADTEALALVKAELQERHTCTDLGPSALRFPVLLSTPPSDESVEPSGPYPELVGCLICEGEIYAGAMAAQELRWLTYLLTDLGERPHSPPVLYVDNKAMLALCHEQRLEHRTKHIAISCA
ncbi:unnamed protein product [Closterium sp. NIES-54]